MFKDTAIQRDHHRLYAREHTGDEPPIVLMHGFPDNSHLYDRLVPHLSPPRRVVVFDFLGWGSSDKPAGYSYTATNQTGDLDAVIEQLQLEPVVLVAHDASGPPAIDWALAHPDRVAALVLLNTYYCDMPTLRPPEAIWLFSTPAVRQPSHLPSNVLVAGRAVLQGCVGTRGIPAAPLPAVRRHAERAPGVLPLERGFGPDGPIPHASGPPTEGVHTARADHFWGGRSVPQSRSGAMLS
jgi:pimeloyl-ACP methyl ester carboxylesterase